MQIRKFSFHVLLVASISCHSKVYGQNYASPDSLKNNRFLKSLIAPTSLIGVGLLIKNNPEGLNTYIRDKRNKAAPDFHTTVDDYILYVPIASVYALNLSGVKGKNNYGNSLALLVKSEILSAVTVKILKRNIHVLRPDESTTNSFPSGHTAQAFVAATFFHKEFGAKSIWYSVASYSCATAVATFRVLNNRHWVSDVLAGAGIGILSTNLVYYTHRYKWVKKSARAVVMPTYSDGVGLYVCYNFK